jgi:hypothetical protein
MRMKTFLAAATLSLSLAGPAMAATLTANPLTAGVLLNLAKGGDKVVLSGEIGPMTLGHRRFRPPMVIDASRATITAMEINDVEGLIICGGTWRKSDEEHGGALRVDKSSGVRVERARFVGPGERPGVLARGYGVRFLNSRDVAVIDSTFAGFRGGLTMNDVEGFAVERNTFLRMSSDGFIGGAVRRGILADNTASGFRIIKDEHPDGIQLFSPPGMPPSADVVITRNRIVGDTQGIGLYPGTNERGYDRITITNNDIEVSYPPAIAVDGVRGLVLKDNKVRTLPGAQHRASIHQTASTGVDRSGNTVGPGGGSDAADDPKPFRRRPPTVTPRPASIPSGQAACPAS